MASVKRKPTHRIYDPFNHILRHKFYDWTDSAKCKGTPLSAWFLKPGENHAPLESARKICRGCPVKKDCLAFAEANDIYYGVWGGLTPSERKKRILDKGQK